MKKYRKKPIIIEAERWFKYGDVPEASIYPFSLKYDLPENKKDTCEWCGKPYKEHGKCPTRGGYYIICPGDYIIKSITGEFYPCDPGTFVKNYEEIEKED